ncbi:hypothetical protein CANCADRAFT_42429 [Tortispora caseinolytica NRRL Y-17796]|uniref:Uncharacterized protein n=1 Tax=Tortispora caseinolytica NRRL Y-17796 TaxID=767744 RepID=A0A1E4TJE9_9ASCO|nr:hypothetical protein CANCADRAFT_42429 [Tortispora caseinolytica NRRL Y-17796]
MAMSSSNGGSESATMLVSRTDILFTDESTGLMTEGLSANRSPSRPGSTNRLAALNSIPDPIGKMSLTGISKSLPSTKSSPFTGFLNRIAHWIDTAAPRREPWK